MAMTNSDRAFWFWCQWYRVMRCSCHCPAFVLLVQPQSGAIGPQLLGNMSMQLLHLGFKLVLIYYIMWPVYICIYNYVYCVQRQMCLQLAVGHNR